MSTPVDVRGAVEAIATEVGIDVSDQKVQQTIAVLESDTGQWGVDGGALPRGVALFVTESFASLKAQRKLEAGIDWSTERPAPRGFENSRPGEWMVRTGPYELVRDWSREFRGVVTVMVADVVGDDGRIRREAPRFTVHEGEEELGLANAGRVGLALLEAVEMVGGFHV